MTFPHTDAAARTLPLGELLAGLAPASSWQAFTDLEITDVSLDSRRVKPGGAFLALRGLRSHGLDYAAQAVANGAAVVLWEPAAGVPAPSFSAVRSCPVPELSAKVGALADRFFAQPSAALKIAAVTGTNGKTTTAYLLASAAERCGLSAAYSGTVGFGRISALQTSAYTTPDCITVHRQLAELRDARVQALGMEVSSHALDQGRVDAVRIDTAVFTNLTRDHLDYHGSFAAYGEAKARLFRWPGLHHRIINMGDEFGARFAAEPAPGARTTLYLRGPAARLEGAERWLCAPEVVLAQRGIELHIESSWGACVLRSQLLGAFNAENLLAVLAVLLAWDVPLARAVHALEQAHAPAGRMELHGAATGKRAVIDYAHTPDALDKALRALRQHCAGQLICVFGCGGDRDPGKRPMMGALAEQLADRVIVTDDNPRSEDPKKIIADILSGMRRAHDAVLEHDRAEAIRRALQAAGPEDLVLIAGKGHENYQIIGDETRPFSDREVVLQVLGGQA